MLHPNTEFMESQDAGGYNYNEYSINSLGMTAQGSGYTPFQDSLYRSDQEPS
jgi:hypothetical protein